MSTQEKFPPDDPRLTAYALGEMEPAERAEFEQLLQQDAAARALVAEINAAAHTIGAALASEPLPTAVPPDLSRWSKRGDWHLPGRETKRSGAGKFLQFPYLYYTLSGVAAACFAVAFFYHGPVRQPRDQVKITEVDLTKLSPVTTPAGSEGGLGGMATGSGKWGGMEFVEAKSTPVSAFLPIVDTTGVNGLLREIRAGRRPVANQVQIEALVNHFAPRLSAEVAGTDALRASLEVAEAPWASAHRLVRIGLQGRPANTDGGLPLIARDLSVQVAFNPALVRTYRLIGFENRVGGAVSANATGPLTASKINGGHAVTALYEIVPQNSAARLDADPGQIQPIGQLEKPVVALSEELLTVKLSYKLPEGGQSQLAEFPLRDSGQTFEQASPEFKFVASVAAFGMVLRDSPHKGSATLSAVENWARSGLAVDGSGARSDFIGLVKTAERWPQSTP